MDSPGPIDDEVIADSEGEMDEDEHPGNRGILAAHPKDVANTVSQVSEFTLTGQLHGKITSSISTFTVGPSQALWRQNSLDNQKNRLLDVDSFIGSASIADRAKMRQRNSKSSIQSSSTKPNATASSNGGLENADPSSDIMELTSDDNELSPQLSKPKPKARPKIKLKEKDKPRVMNNDNVSGTTENVDKSLDAIPDPRPRPRPRPRPLAKRSKTAHESTVPPPPLALDIPGLLPALALASHAQLPITTSPVRPRLHTSQIPPSDPPLPTLNTIHDEDDLPQIETLPNLDFDGPLSSPSSLFSDLSGTTKKRKRTMLDVDIDELASDGDLSPRQGAIGAGARRNYENGAVEWVPPFILQPPPTFFAGSSSSISGGGSRPPQVPSEPVPEVIDLTMLPSTIVPTSAVVLKKAVKARKSRQKKGKGDAITMGEDELDDDFDPTESTKKGKTKPKPKPKVKKGIKAKQGEGPGEVKVSIVSKPRTQKTKGKDKEGATAGNKGTFKSREFIDNSGSEEDPIRLTPSAKDLATSESSHNISPSTNGKGAHMSTSTESKTAEISVITSVGATSTPFPSETLLALASSRDKPVSSFSSNQMNKKRKSVIESDLEDEDEGEKDQVTVGPGSKKRPGKQGKNYSKVDEDARSMTPPTAAKKGNMVRSNEDNENNVIEVDLPVGLSKGKKPALRLEDEADEGSSRKKERAKGKRRTTKSQKAIEVASKGPDDDEDHEDIQEQQLEVEVTKENVIPQMKSATTPNVENPGLFPSLHSRYEIAPRRSSLPMSELIRRANSIPGSPFATTHARTSSSSSSIARPTKTGTYSPYLKSSRSFLSRIAPLHPNRRTPPPPPPPPPPKKKTKKELEMEEKWEEEMIDSVGGTSEWTCLADDKKKELRRAKWAREMGDCDD